MNNDNWISSYEEHAQTLLASSQTPGLVIGINKERQQLYRKGFGYRDVERKLEITPDTIMGLGSVTKSFACVAIMQLQEAGSYPFMTASSIIYQSFVPLIDRRRSR